MKQTLFLGFIFAGAVAASADSFELVMIADATSNTVVRYDGYTGAYLGSFGGGYLEGVTSIAVNKTTNTAFVLDRRADGSTYIKRFNFNTGSFLGLTKLAGTFNTNTQLSIDSVSGDLIFAESISNVGAINWRRYRQDGTASNPASYSITPGGSAFSRGAALGPFGDLFASYGANGGGTLIRTTGGIVKVLANTPGTPRQMAISGTQGAVALEDGSLLRFDTFSGGNTVFAPVTSSLISSSGVGFAHNGTVFQAGANASGATLVQRFDWVNGIPLGSFLTPQASAPRGVAIVLAPEPGSVLAIGFGIVCLVRRRKSRA